VSLGYLSEVERGRKEPSSELLNAICDALEVPLSSVLTDAGERMADQERAAYNATGGAKGPSNYMMLLVTRSRMEGFVVFDYADRYAEGARQLAQWLQEGKLKSREDIVKGFETFPETLLKLPEPGRRGFRARLYSQRAGDAAHRFGRRGGVVRHGVRQHD